jgi:hydroxypyruvate reductase
MGPLIFSGLDEQMEMMLAAALGARRLTSKIDFDAKILIARAQPVGDTILSNLPNLQHVISVGVGTDHIDRQALRARNISLSNSPGATDVSVADHAVALLLALGRQIGVADRFVRTQQWLNQPFPLTKTVSGQKIGIFGLGAIGKQIAKRLSSFDCMISYCNRTRLSDCSYSFFPDLADLALWSDYLVVAASYSSLTHHSINSLILQALGSDGYLINIARGKIVDEGALIEALRVGTIRGAALDVFENEPNVPAALIDSERVILTPHIGGRTFEARKAICENIIRDASSLLQGGPAKFKIAE